MSDVHLGFELVTGKPVKIPVRHMCVTGQTQESGKTTTLEALIARSERRAIAFITKRGERSFEAGRKILPYFKERADWEFIESVLEAIMRQKMKFERAWIVRASKGAHSLDANGGLCHFCGGPIESVPHATWKVTFDCVSRTRYGRQFTASRTLILCDRHAATFATKHGLSFPPLEANLFQEAT